MYTPTVQALLKSDQALEAHHSVNLCSQCSNAVWMTTQNATYTNSGSMNDYLRFLMANAEDQNDALCKYRCYCKVLHEYHEFLWYDENQKPHIIDKCDAFAEYTGKVEEVDSGSPKKRMAQHFDVKQKVVMENS